jgi:hypothetical protein
MLYTFTNLNHVTGHPPLGRVNVDVQFHEKRAHFSDRRQGQLLDVIGLCTTMNDEAVREGLDANTRDTTVRSLINPAFEQACDRIAIVPRAAAIGEPVRHVDHGSNRLDLSLVRFQ